MKWIEQPKGCNWRISACGGWMINAAKVQGKWVYTLVRLGTKRGNLWEGSEIVKTGSKADCEEAADEHG